MSNRAYRIEKLVLGNNDVETLNLTHSDKQLINLLDEQGFLSQLNENLTGIAYLEVEVAEEIIKKAEEFKLPDWTRELLTKDIKWAKEQNESEIGYYCT